MPQPAKLSLHFIIPDGKTKEMCSEDMRDAFKTCEDLKLQPLWETETQCLGRESSRQDVYVFDEFAGKLFKSLKTPLCVRVVGARCLLTCVRRNISIPDTTLPVYTAAMHNVSVTTTQLDSDLKGEIKQLVTNMGGMYCNSLRGCVTHVVVGNVISVKCQESKKNNVELMTVDWVRAVWKTSLTRDVVAVDEEFHKYRCPLFYGVVATCTKLRTAEKNELAALIQNNGGVFKGFLDASTTNLLIVGDPTGDKFHCAQQNDISCLTLQWVRDCVAAGDIMPFEDYVVVKGKQCSTPVHDQSKFLPDFSAVSSIEGRPAVSHVDETLNSTMVSIGDPSSAGELTLRNSLNAQQVEEAIQQLVASNGRHPGPFLDGCKIFLSGFTTLQLDRLRRVLNRAGATRIDEISESLTHVVVGLLNSMDMKLMKNFTHKPQVVNVHWLVQCARLECPVPEEQFLCCGRESAPVEPPSPLSKKGVAALQRNVARVPAFPNLEPVQEAPTSPLASEPDQPPAEDLIHQYLHSQPGDEMVENAPLGKAGENESPECKVTELSAGEESTLQSEFIELNYFDGLVFEILGYDEEPESKEMIIESVLGTGGQLVRDQRPDYAITPCVVDQGFLWNAKQAVNYLWLEECSEQQQVLLEPLDYFYRTAKVNQDTRPLEGCVLTPSSYVGRERIFLIHLMQALGARVQHVFSRIAVPEKELLPATHLITQDTNSPKYRAAVKWRLLVVNHEWLLACARDDRRVEEGPFVVSPETSRTGSGEEFSMIDKTGVKHTPHKAPQEVGSTSRTNVNGVTVASETSSRESVCRAIAASDTLRCNASRSAKPGADKSDMQSGSAVGTRAISAATPTRNRGDQLQGSVEVGTRVNSVATVVDRGDGTSLGEAEKGLTPVACPVNSAVRKSCLPNQSPAVGTGTPTGPSAFTAFTTPADNRRRLGMLFSQETPLKYGGAESSTPSTPRDPNYISTPETPYGQFLVTDPSPNTRKNWKRWLDTVPDFPKSESPAKKRRDSTPMSELKRRIWDTILPNKQADEGGGRHLQATDSSQGDQVPEVAPERRLAALPSSRQSKQVEDKAGSHRASVCLQQGSPPSPEVRCPSMSPAQSNVKESGEDTAAKIGPGVHTQIVRLNEALSAKKQQDSGGGRKKRCAETDKTSSSASADDTVSMEHSKEYKALMGVEVPTEIAVTWEYRQFSEQSEPQTQSQDAVINTPRVFSLSGMDAQRAHYEDVISSLGGQVSQSNTYDPASTHLVCERLARSERMLGSIAAGKWVLHPDYIVDSEQAGHFLPEEKYEWGSPACQASRELAPNSLQHALASAAHRWRSKVAQDGCPAFTGLKVLVHVGKERQDQFKRCVQAGGGKVVLLSEWCSANVCIVDVNKVSLDKPISLAAFVRNNIPCVPTLFLHDFLMREPPPSPEELAIAEYKELCRQREQSALSSS